MLNLIWYINEQEDYGEQALVNTDSKEIVLKGDYYHDKISDKIKGFLQALDYAKVEYNLQKEYVSKEKHDTLDIDLNFYYEDIDDECVINTDYAIDYSSDNDTSEEKTNKSDVVIDDIDAFLKGEYDNVQQKDCDEVNEEMDEEVEQYKFFSYLHGEEFYFSTDSIPLAIYSAWDCNSYLYIYNKYSDDYDFLYSIQEPLDVNNASLMMFNLKIINESSPLEIINTVSNEKIDFKDVNPIPLY